MALGRATPGLRPQCGTASGVPRQRGGGKEDREDEACRRPYSCDPFVSRELLSRGGQLRQRGYYRLYVAFAVPGPTVILVSPSID